MLSEQEIGEHISYLTAAVHRLSADHAGLDECVDIAERLGVLREQYRTQPDSLASYVSRLSELRRRFDEILETRIRDVVDRFHWVNEQVRLAEQEKAYWRDLLIRISVESHSEQIEGSEASVRVRSSLSRSMPRAGSPERAELESLLLQYGCWEQVSQLSRPKLDRAMKGGVLAKVQADEIERLCPASQIYQVTCRARTP